MGVGVVGGCGCVGEGGRGKEEGVINIEILCSMLYYTYMAHGSIVAINKSLHCLIVLEWIGSS